MAETVLSMARTVLRSAVGMAASAAAAEMGLLVGVRKDIWFIKDELETIQAFLEVAEAIKKKDALLKVWAKQVRDLSYNIEDCLSEFMVHVGSQSLAQRLTKLKDRHEIAMRIRDLKSRVEEVSIRNTRYSFIKMEAVNNIQGVNSYTEDVRSHSANNIDEAELVGFSKPKVELIKLMDVNTAEGNAKVICVVGMGGLGKTTLARKIYDSEEDIVKKFPSRAWITVSQSFNKIGVLKDMINQLLGGDSLKRCLNALEGKVVQVEDLTKYLTTWLKYKRYFIILDDLWTIDAWKWINDIVFSSSNIKGSRIIVTTRDIGLAKECTLESLIYPLKPLEPVDATTLLLRKSRRTHEDMGKVENFKDIVEQLVKKCGCLPLAVLTIGGILATKRLGDWEFVYNQLPSELESNPSLEVMRRMVTLSYSHLPSHLKSCFLYLSIFPEDYEIKRRHLIERWIAEGFVKSRVGWNIEDVGKSYFNELINRSMIEPSRVSVEGNVKSCRVHDIMRDVMVSISRDENFVYLAGENVTSVAENFRHVAFHCRSNNDLGMDWCHVRSLTMFSERPKELPPSLCSPNLRMLRALDLEGAQFRVTEKDISNIGVLRHLKYMNLSYPKGYSNIYKLPRCIGKLQGLQILDIRDTYISTLPVQVSKLRSLRSLRCCKNTVHSNFGPHSPSEQLAKIRPPPVPMIVTPVYGPAQGNRVNVVSGVQMAYSSRWFESAGVSLPRGIGNLKELLILEVVDITRTSGKAVKEMGELTQLRKLSVVTQGATEEKCKLLCVAIQKLSSLRSLRMEANGRGNGHGTLEWLHSLVSPPPLLKTLNLVGSLGEEMPAWVGSLMHLVKVYFEYNRLKEESKTLEILGTLPNLILFRLGWDSYVGDKLVFKAEAFPSLMTLDIWGLNQPRQLAFEKGSSPKLETVQISGVLLRLGIIGIKHLPSLKEITLGDFAHVANLAVLRNEVDIHPNRPMLRLAEGRTSHDLGRIPKGSNVQVIEENEELEPPQIHEPAETGETSSQTSTSGTNSEDDELEDVQGSNVVKVDETEEESALAPETGTAGESSQPEVVLAMPTSKDSEGEGSNVVQVEETEEEPVLLPEIGTAGESSQSEVVEVMSTMEVR
ncbi:hypothetical protein VPH35_069918 [Triticum aestivum]